MKDRIYTVTQFNRMVKEYLEEEPEFRDFFLKGELSGVTYYKSGHLYFTLKDSTSQIKCAAFNYRYKKIAEDLKEGDQVKIFGDVGFYEVRGDFQILVRYVEKEDKLGEMYANLEKLKVKLEKEGLFSPLYKKRLPKYPQKIGVVTAYTGAAFQDIINTTRKRYKNIDIYIYSAKVQGVGAKEEIEKGIKVLNKIEDLDLIVVGRGGGSAEDLWAFNEENVARAIFESKIPIISAVGHEVDNLLSDLVADVRAATPTQAIEIAIPVKREIEEGLEKREKYLKNILEKTLKLNFEKLERRKNNYFINNFEKVIEEKNRDLILKEEKINFLVKEIFKSKEYKYNLALEKILNLNPISTLKRGYSITKKNKKILKNVEDVKINDKIETVLENGKIISEVKEILK